MDSTRLQPPPPIVLIGSKRCTAASNGGGIWCPICHARITQELIKAEVLIKVGATDSRVKDTDEVSWGLFPTRDKNLQREVGRGALSLR